MTDDRDEECRARMRLIAEALNLPRDYFYSETAMQGSIADANECLRLWCRIKTPQGRRLALEALRALVNDEES